ncbi:MAG: HAMP domain-containing protein, partial [Thermodesulfovibrionales bacterium]|nr:HAMP domain-containing protein [Thermodesulfovibrionales bacterium]
MSHKLAHSVRSRIVLTLIVLFLVFMAFFTALYIVAIGADSGPSQSLHIIYFGGIITGLAAAIILGFMLARTIIKPLGRLEQQVLNLTDGDLTARHGKLSNDEIGRLG